jgi:hypothetical protein
MILKIPREAASFPFLKLGLAWLDRKNTSGQREKADRRRAAPSVSSRWFNVKTPVIH